MMFEQCKIVIFDNIIFMKNIGNFPEKCNGNFPDKYENFRTNFPPHITSLAIRNYKNSLAQADLFILLGLSCKISVVESINGRFIHSKWHSILESFVIQNIGTYIEKLLI